MQSQNPDISCDEVPQSQKWRTTY